MAKLRFKELDQNKPGFPDRTDLIVILERFPIYTERHWQLVDEKKHLGLFGKLTPAVEMRVRPHVNAVLVYALLYKTPFYDPSVGGVDRDTLLSRVVQGLDYIAETHISNEGNPLPKHLWGDDWQSAWWTTQVAITFFLMRKDLPERTVRGVERVIEFEADRFIDVEPPSGLLEDTKCEENAWDCTLLAWARNIMPQHPNSAKWELAGKIFAMNSFSSFDDRFNNSWFDGKRVRDWISTHNIFPDFTVENHSSFHPGYLATFNLLCNAHTAYLLHNRGAPPHFQFNVLKCYDVWKRFILWKGRVAYPCGHDWPNVRVPNLFSFAFFSKVYDNPLSKILYRWSIIYLDRFQRISSDGSFYGGFLLPEYKAPWAQGRRLEFECDVASNIALSYLLNPDISGVHATKEKDIVETGLGVYNYKYSEFLTAKTPYMFASFSWRSLRHRPLGLVIPFPKEDFGGWKDESLTGVLKFKEAVNRVRTVFHNDYLLDNGFLTTGIVKRGWRKQMWMASQLLLFVSLPDKRTCILYDRVTADVDAEVTLNRGLGYFLENDLLNGNKRTITFSKGEMEVQGLGGEVKEIPIRSPYLKIDNAITIYADSPRLIYIDSSERNDNFWRSFVLDAVYIPFNSGTYKKGDVIREYAAFLVCGKDEEAKSPLRHKSVKNDVVGMIVSGRDQKTYLFILNLSKKAVRHTVTWKSWNKTYCLNPYEARVEAILD